ncbi:hypothetical protein TCAL_03175 [Tigriopus californicus]|uniref:Ig-like domain-containing protein n=1 Tax=Tigriopus californicus TaxID=6832 RepID=A0A553N930_TIGCA|nr:uncharacterized protein LOC131885288 isoform X1 [Tigriopus californicus]TRY61879.1 hypothetical protein TCAL_03175 [Tigriopus californicus]
MRAIRQCLLWVFLFSVGVAPLGSEGSRDTGSWVCNNGTQIIAGSHHRAGVLETPNFPHWFPLPLSCVWVLDYSALQDTHFVQIYFTQFYLSEHYFSISALNRSEFEEWQQSGFTSRNQSSEISYDFQRLRIGPLHGNFDLIVFRLNISAEHGFNFVHKRTVDVFDSFGSQIAFEITRDINPRTDACNLTSCSMNGICQVDYNTKRLKSFKCSCKSPNRPFIAQKQFEGPKCDVHPDIHECTRETCNHHGECKFFTSRIFNCHCEKGYTGRFCEIDLSSGISSAPRDPCDDEMASISIGNNLEEIAEYLSLNVTSRLSEEVQSFVRSDAERSGRLYFYSKSPDVVRKIGNVVLPELEAYYRLHPRRPFYSDTLSQKRVHQRLCALKVKMRPTGILKQDDEVHMTCLAEGGSSNPKTFQWIKDRQFLVSPNVSKRVETSFIGVRGNTSVLTLRHLGKKDNGLFECEVSDEELQALIPLEVWRSSLRSTGDGAAKHGWSGTRPFVTHSSTARSVMVASKPEVEVFPRSLTILESHEDLHLKEFHTLNCLAHQQVSLGIVSQYRFTWKRNGVDLAKFPGNSSHIFVENVWFPYQKTTVTIGLMLKIREIQKDETFTCEVSIDGHDRAMTSTTVKVYHAQTLNEVCLLTEEDMVQWPIAKKMTTVSRPCQIDGSQGLMWRKCNPIFPARASWSNHKDISQCLRHWLLNVENQVDNYLKGYVSENSSKMVTNFFKDVPILPVSPPYRGEFDRLVSITLELISYLRSVKTDVRESAKDFFEGFVPWLFRPAEEFLNEGAGDVSQYAQMYKMVNDGALMFASKLELTQEQVFPHSGSECRPDLLVQIGRVNGTLGLTETPRHQSERNLTTPGVHEIVYMSHDQMQNRDKRNVSQKKERDSGRCTESASVEIRARSAGAAKRSKRTLVMAVIKFNEIDKRLGGFPNDLDKRLSMPGKGKLGRNSSAVTVLVESETNSPLLDAKRDFQVMIFIRFYGYVFRQNDSTWSNLGCGRLTLANDQTFEWDPRVRDCTLQWHPEGLTCACQNPGTYALFWSGPKAQNSSPLSGGNPTLVLLCCGGCLTVCLLAFFVLTRQMWRQKFASSSRRGKAGPGAEIPTIASEFKEAFPVNPVLLIQILISGTLVVLIAFMILVVADPYYCSWWTSLVFQYLFLVLFGLQLSLMLTLYIKMTRTRFSKTSRLALLGTSFLLPAVFCLVLFGYQEPLIREMLLADYESRVESTCQCKTCAWFVLMQQPDFVAFVSALILSAFVYMGLFYQAKQSSKTRILAIKESQKRKLESLVHRSGWMMLALLSLATCCIIFVNTNDKSFIKFVFALAVLMLGIVVFLCYLTTYEGEFGAVSPLGSLRLSLNAGGYHSKSKSGKSTPSLPGSGHRCCHSAESCPANETERQFLLQNNSFEQSWRGGPGSQLAPSGRMLLPRLASFDKSCLNSRDSSTLYDPHAEQCSQIHGIKMSASQENSGSHSINFCRSISGPNSSKESTISHQYQRSCSLSEHRCGTPAAAVGVRAGRFMSSKQAQTRCLLSLDSPQDASTPTKELLPQKAPPTKTTEAVVHGGVPGAPLSLMQVIDEAKQAFHPIRTNEKGFNIPENTDDVDLVLPSQANGRPSIHGGSFSSGDSGMVVQPRSRKSTNTSGIRTSSEGSIDETDSLDGTSLNRNWSVNSSSIPETRRPSSLLGNDDYVEPLMNYENYMTMTNFDQPQKAWNRLGKAGKDGLPTASERYFDTNDLLKRAREKIRIRTCSTSDSGPSSEPDSTDGGGFGGVGRVGSPNLSFEVSNTPPQSMSALAKQLNCS